MKTGISMGGRIIKTRNKKHHAIAKKEDDKKIERGKICIECNYYNEGFCNKHKAWCIKVNYICLGIKNPYEYKIPKAKVKSKKTNKKIKNKTK